MREEEIIEPLSDEELNTIVERQKSRHELDDMLKKTASNRDEEIRNDLFK